jgi:hypothetical protein
MEDGACELSWHRALDRVIQRGLWHSYRGSHGGIWTVHPPNARKEDLAGWMLAMDAVDRGHAPAVQASHPDLVGTTADWLLPKRDEPFVFVVCGRDVPPGRALRCLESLKAPPGEDWGVILLDDDSSPRHSNFLLLASEGLGRRVTHIRTRPRRGLLANLVCAVRNVCTDPDSVIVTLDLDDALLGKNVLERLREEYGTGADMTVGSMLRTDKPAAYPVNFKEPARGNVWQHLRSFKKRLFDDIPDNLLRLNGEYVTIPNDWAYTLPLVRLATSPRWIRDPLYLHEPSGLGKGRDRAQREDLIARVIHRYCTWTRSMPQTQEGRRHGA